MKYWFDTKFIEDGRTIDLISIGIVAEDGREYYAISTDFDARKANSWVKENVLSKLPARYAASPESGGIPSLWEASKAWKSRQIIAIEIMAFLKKEALSELSRLGSNLSAGLSSHPDVNVKRVYDLIPEQEPEIWAYYADYNWVAFCQLFGTMMDLPKGLPIHCCDIKQWCDQLGSPKLPEQKGGEHNALEDARWNKKAWEFLEKYSAKWSRIKR